jgi:hypothetical protein
MQRPSSWADYERWSRDEALFALLRVRLVEIAFVDKGAASVNAIQLLFDLGTDSRLSDLGDVSTEQLEQARARAEQYIRDLEAGARRDGLQN